MKISAFLPPAQIRLDVPVNAKDEMLRYIAETLGRLNLTNRASEVYGALTLRETMMSTGIGGGLAIPHALTPAVDRLCILLIRPEFPIPFDALDGLPVGVVFALLVPENETTLHLRTLAAVSALCRRPGFLDEIRSSTDSEAVWNRLRETETAAGSPG